MACLAELLKSVVRRERNGSAANLEKDAAQIRASLWTHLFSRAQFLLMSIDTAFGGVSGGAVRALIDEAKVMLRLAAGILEKLAERMRSSSNRSQQKVKQLKVAFGVPGVLGCADASGRKVLWSPLIDKRFGVHAAFTHLGLDMMGLPAARLRSGLQLPGGLRLLGECRGGPSYASCSVLWRDDRSKQFAVRADLGSDRRVWTRVLGAFGEVLSLATIAMPTSGSHNDPEWIEELNGLLLDLECILVEQCGPKLLRVVVQGDFNFQPGSLGGDPDPSSCRRNAWNNFMVRWQLALHNPLVGGDVPGEAAQDSTLL